MADNLDIEITKALDKAMDYPSFVNQFEQHALKETSSGNTQSELLTNFTKLNYSRVKRLNKTIKLTDQITNTLQNLNSKLTFLLITESWCGDAAQTTPVIHKIAEQSENIDLKIVYRDENDGLVQHFLTNGNKAIPILILLDENNNLITHWGPRPTTATNMVNDFKQQHGGLTDEFKKDLQVWYNKDKGEDTMNDFNNILTKI